MDAALIGSAVLLGLAGTPHCAAMCGGPGAAVCAHSGRRGQLAFHTGRVLGYAAVGGAAAASVSSLALLAQWSPALRPLWALLHALLLALGGWMLVTGRQPGWMGSVGRVPAVAGAGGAGGAGGGAWAPVSGPVPTAPGRAWKPAVAGALWVAWPCGLLQSALLVASLTGSAASGAGAMAGFALASSGGLVLAPWLWQQVRRSGRGPALERGLVRLAGALLVGSALFALGAGVWHQVAAFCGLA
jgi:sulfite exporter TauE/SafE